MVNLSLSPRFEAYENDGLYDTAQLRDYFEQKLLDKSSAFDARNGNTAQQTHSDTVAQMVARGRTIAVEAD